MIDLVSGAPEPTVIRDRYPTMQECVKLERVKGKWAHYHENRYDLDGVCSARGFHYQHSGAKSPGVTWRAVSHEGAPISLEVEG